MKQTAVEWLLQEFTKMDSQKKFKDIVDQAKEMEKQHIIDACNAGLSGIPRSSEQYYNETFKP